MFRLSKVFFCEYFVFFYYWKFNDSQMIAGHMSEFKMIFYLDNTVITVSVGSIIALNTDDWLE